MTDKPTLTLYNSLTRKKEPFTPQDPKRVTMYNCGPTVYSFAHIGNARAAVVADVLFRVLRHIYGEDHVVYARNITDVDDKIIASAKEQNKPISEITEKYARIYNEDLAAIGCLEPTFQPKATEHIGGMIDMISDLIEKGFAYPSEGHVFFDVSKYDDYGKLSGNTLDALRGGDRVGEGEVARKRNSADFVLWKPELDGVGWDAPFGRGRPGWHIECSAMAKATLCDKNYGNVIDIHCGGVDLKFPHHENEKAQSCCANGTDKFANVWVHNEFLNMAKKDGSSDKMSKSLGNVKLIRDLLKDWDGEVIRLALLKAHYRSELVWSENLLKESKAQLDRWYRELSNLSFFIPNGLGKIERDNHDIIPTDFIIPFTVSIDSIFEDLNTPILQRVIGEIFYHKTSSGGVSLNPLLPNFHQTLLSSPKLRQTLWELSEILGILQKDPKVWFKGGLDTDKFDQLVKEYDTVRADAVAAKAAGDKARMGDLFKRSDSIRDELKADGIAIETGPDGSTWRKA